MQLFKIVDKKKMFYTVLRICTAAVLTAQTAPDAGLYQELLQYRLQNDSTYRQLHLQSSIAAHEAEKTRLESHAVLEIGSGDTLIGLNADPKKASFKTAPYAGVLLPSYNNTGIRVSVPYSQTPQSFTNPISGTRETAQLQNSGAGITISTDIYSKNAAAQHFRRNQADYTALQAQQKEQQGAALAEKQFVTDVQQLFDSYRAVLDKDLREVQAEIRFQQTAEQGYAKESAKMRTANLELLNAKREKQEAAFVFSSTVQLFLESCGKQDTISDIPAFLTVLADSIPVRQPVDIAQFPAASYRELREAEHTASEQEVKRSIDLSPFSVGAEAGYRLNQQKITAGTYSQREQIHTVSAGLNMKFPGGKAYTGVDIPLANPHESTIKIGCSWNPLFLYYRKLEIKNAALAQNIEQLRIEDAKKAYRQKLQTAKITESRIAWQQEATANEIAIYRQNAEDHENWFRKGIITEFERLQAALEYKKALIRHAKAKTAVIIFNIDTELLFVSR
ncbi:MAG: hypothetical protein ACTTH8_01095 [Treponema sp.]